MVQPGLAMEQVCSTCSLQELVMQKKESDLLKEQLEDLKKELDEIMTVGQKVPFEYLGTNFVFTVSQAAVEGQEKSNTLERGMISADIYIVFEASKANGIKIVNQREAASSHIFWHKEFNLESLVDLVHSSIVKGMLLYGPPGTGKTNGLADWENVRWKGTKDC